MKLGNGWRREFHGEDRDRRGCCSWHCVVSHGKEDKVCLLATIGRKFENLISLITILYNFEVVLTAAGFYAFILGQARASNGHPYCHISILLIVIVAVTGGKMSVLLERVAAFLLIPPSRQVNAILRRRRSIRSVPSPALQSAQLRHDLQACLPNFHQDR